jgi:hypothetical protein
MALLATCPDDVSMKWKFVDMTEAVFSVHNGSPRSTIAPTASYFDNTRIPGHWLNSQWLSWSVTQHQNKTRYAFGVAGFSFSWVISL